MPTRLLPLLCLLAAPALCFAGPREDGERLKQEGRHAEAAEAYALHLQAQPGDQASRRQYATLLGWTSRYTEAMAQWQQVLQATPGDTDARLAIARLHYWNQQPDLALAQLDALLTEQPNLADALALRGDVQLARGQRAEARADFQAAAAQPGGLPVIELEQRLERAAEPLRARLELGAAYDNYSRNRAPGNSQTLELGYRFTDSAEGYVRADFDQQFDTDDQTFVVGTVLRPAPRWLLALEAGATPDASFRPDNQWQIQGEWAAANGVQVLLGLRQLRYAEGSVTTLTPGLRAQLWKTSVELRHGFTDNLDGSSTGVTSLRFGWETPRVRPYLAFTLGDEALPPQDRARIGVAAAGAYWVLTPRLGLRTDVGVEDRENAYIHRFFGLGLSLRF